MSRVFPSELQPGKTPGERLAGRSPILAALVVGGVAFGVTRLLGLGGHPASPISATLPPLPDGGCWRQQDCASARPGSICRHPANACIPLVSPDCVVLAEPADLQDGRTVFLGALFPQGAASEQVRALDRARRDFAAAIAGGSAAISSENRPIAVVACGGSRDATAAARHLVEDVGVAAVVGFGGLAEGPALARDVFLAHGAVVMLATADDAEPALASADGRPRLVWRTSESDEERGRALARFALGPRAPGSRARPGGTWTVASVHGWRDGAVFAALAAAARAGDDVRFEDVTLSGPSDYAAAVDRLAAQAPDVVVYADDDLVPRVLEPLELRWRGAKRPTYVSSAPWPPAANAVLFASADASRRPRFVALGSPGARVAEAAEGDAGASIAPVARAAYDAFYVLAYAAHAASDTRDPDDATRPLDGARLARGFRRLEPPGIAVAVGPPRIFDALGILRAGGSIDLAGLASTLDFAAGTGAPAFDLPFECLGPDARGKGASAVPCGVRYETGADRLDVDPPAP